MKAINETGKTLTPEKTPPLDRIDRTILKTLQVDASISNVALAEKVRLSPCGLSAARGAAQGKWCYQRCGGAAER